MTNNCWQVAVVTREGGTHKFCTTQNGAEAALQLWEERATDIDGTQPKTIKFMGYFDSADRAPVTILFLMEQIVGLTAIKLYGE